MNVRQIYRALEAYLPATLSCAWDHDGVQCMTEPEREARRILCTLDVTQKTVEHAIAANADLIISHHPLLFRPLYALDGTSASGALLGCLARHGIALFSFHTRADAAEGGTSDLLCARLGLSDVHAVPSEEGTLLRIGMLTAPMSVREFASHVRTSLEAEAVNLAARDASRTVRRVAVLGGEGGDFVSLAAREGADVFVAGRIGYHRMLDALHGDTAMLEVGHYASEREIVFFLSRLASTVAPSAEVSFYAPRELMLLTERTDKNA